MRLMDSTATCAIRMHNYFHIFHVILGLNYVNILSGVGTRASAVTPIPISALDELLGLNVNLEDVATFGQRSCQHRTSY